MKAVTLGFIAAVLVHGVILLFGGILFFSEEEAAARAPVREVELFEPETAEEEEEQDESAEDERETRPADELKVEDEKPPEMQQLYNEEQVAGAPTDATPRLDALSLSALESALSGSSSGGESGFGFGVSLASGGRIGGTGAPGSDGGDGLGGDLRQAFDPSDLDQRARPIFQSPPTYPADLRQKKIEGTCTLVFIVDEQGKVLNPRVEKADHEGFERPALEAVKQWRFEPAVRQGEKVRSKVRIPIRFSVSE